MTEKERFLTIFLRLQAGQQLSKQELAEEFGVSSKTIQRDFNHLETVLANQLNFTSELVYDPKTYKRYFKGTSKFDKKDILVISKILLENRAFNKVENDNLLKGLLDFLAKEEQKEIKQIIGSEHLNYEPLHNQQDRIDKIWEFSEFIRKEELIDFNYTSPRREGIKAHTALPVALYYDDHYFYLKSYDLAYDAYIDLRLDRLSDWRLSERKKPLISYGEKFRDGDVRNYKVDAFSGKNITLRILYKEEPSYIFDKFPKSKIVKECSQGLEMEIITQNTFGLKRYLMSQLDALTVLSPQSLVEDIKETLKKMQKNY